MNLFLAILLGGALKILFYSFKKWIKTRVKSPAKQKRIIWIAVVVMLWILAVYTYLINSI